MACGRDEQNRAADAGMDHTPINHTGTEHTPEEKSGGQGPDETAGTRTDKRWSTTNHARAAMSLAYSTAPGLRCSGRSRGQKT